MKAGQVAVITGAGSGIGRALAVALDARECSLVLADIQESGLAETQALLKRPALTRHLDVSKRVEVENLASETMARHGRVDLVVNNAGVTVHDTIVDVDYEDFEWVMNINFWGVVYGTKTFLPLMLKQRSGVIANVSSIFGIVGWPLQGVYNASKFAVRGFTEVLWRELEGTGVRAVSIHPGGIKTNIVKSMRFRRGLGPTASHDSTVRLFDAMARTTPERCADTILSGIDRGDKRILIGRDATMLDRLQRAAPTKYPEALEFLERRMAKRQRTAEGPQKAR
jgi:NAD(P)-dependent dehydrogenase (short-subunit alcohol dehydrogenase family)